MTHRSILAHEPRASHPPFWSPVPRWPLRQVLSHQPGATSEVLVKKIPRAHSAVVGSSCHCSHILCATRHIAPLSLMSRELRTPLFGVRCHGGLSGRCCHTMSAACPPWCPEVLPVKLRGAWPSPWMRWPGRECGTERTSRTRSASIPGLSPARDLLG